MFKTLLALLLVLNYIFAESSAQIPEILGDKRQNSVINTGEEKNPLDDALLQALEGLIPSNLKFLAKSVLGNINSRQIIKSGAHYIIPTASDDETISQQCREDSWLYVESLSNFTEWALKMFDASGKVPEGAVSGNYHSIGHFDQCLKAKGPMEFSSPRFTGKYCTVFLKPVPIPAGQSKTTGSQSKKDAVPFLKAASHINAELLSMINPRDLIKQLPSFAFCLPSTCSANDIETGVASITSSIGLPAFNDVKVVPYVSEHFCTVAGTQREYDLVTIVVMVFFVVLAIFLILGTAYDAYLRHRAEERKEGLQTKHRVLLSFSMLTNCTSILDTSNSTEGSLGCLHGIRSLSCFWVILFHTYTGVMDNPNANAAELKEDVLLFSSQVVTNGTLSVDTFLFISGLLVCYTKLRELDKSNGKLNVPWLYLNRYLRLTPLLAFLLAFSATLFKYVSNGPYWGIMALQAEACRNSWWYYLSYTNNFFYGNPDVSSCMGVAWYLAVDMQLFLAAPVFVYVLWRWPRLGVALLGVATIGFTAVTMLIFVAENLPPTFFVTENTDPKILLKFQTDYYQVPWCRIMPYLVGIFAGYVLHTKRNVKVTLKPWVVATGWIVATAVGLSVLFGIHGFVNSRIVPVTPTTVSVLYGSLHRTAWAISLTWIVFACVHGYGGLVNRILSGSIFLPLSRLAYCTFLMHAIWLGYYFSHLRTLGYYTASNMALDYCNNMLASLCLAFIAAICIEVPFLNLHKLFFNSKPLHGAERYVNYQLTAHQNTRGKVV